MLLDSEKTYEVENAAHVEDVRRAASARDRVNTRAKMSLAINGTPPSDKELQGCTFLFDTDVRLDKELQAALTKRCAGFSREFHRCNVFVSHNPWEPGNPLMTWAASLRGAWVISPECLMCGRGASLKYRPAIFIKRHVFVSDAFQRNHPAHWVLLLETLDAHPGLHSWKLILGPAQWATARAHAEKVKRPTDVLAFLSMDEAQASPDGSGVYNLVDATKFLATCIDKSRGSIGLLDM